FYERKGDADAYEMSAEDIFRKIDTVKDEVREVHIVGGHHPDWPFETYVEVVRMIKQRYPWVNVKAYTAAEINYFTRITRRAVDDILAELKDAGLDTLPGGGAEVFSDRLHQLLFPGKADWRRWLEIHKTAHRMGIRSNATMLFGHIETPEEVVEHMIKLRDLEDETPGFFAFIPLSFHPEHTEMSHIRQSSGLYDLKIVALSRLMLDNFPHIKSYWIQLGEKTAQAALHYGASDLDGTIVEEVITHAAGASSPVGMTKDHMVHLIREAGYTPVERDALYNEIRVYA
ncbi:MAG: radical SAM protein, partial [bacterium]